MPDPESPTWLTPTAYQKLQQELEYLTAGRRKQLQARLAEARAHGDFRENADYEAAKDEQGMVEARIRQLRRLLETAEVRRVGDTGAVEIGCLVSVLDEGEEREFFVAPPENKIPGYVLATPGSPLGRVLLGARAGDTVSYEAPGGIYTLTITSVRPFEE
ncbi:MAG: GreA/GreB family elongation factor [Acidimicrobiia bacterium]